MPITDPKSPVTKTLNLNDFGFQKVPNGSKKLVKEEVGEFLINEILDYVGRASSPVSKGAYKSSLSREYADREKQGNTTANLELEGDMLASLDYKNRKGDGIEIGIFSKKQTPKAHGHNTGFNGKRDDLTRKFIPDQDERFKKNIERGIREIIQGFEAPIAEAQESTAQEPAAQLDVTLSNILSDDLIERLIRGEG